MPQIKPLRPRSRDEFDIAIICALSFEADAVLALFDHHWDEDESGLSFGKARGDPNAYSTGVLGQHNVVLAHLPNMGKVAAGTIAAFCRMSYPNISLALVAGICGGAPFYGNKKEEILLGDVIISTGVVQYDIGRRFPNNFEIKDTLDDSLGRPGLEVRNLLSKLKTKRQQGKLQTATRGYLQEVLQETEKPVDYPERSQDIVFPANYRHKHQEPSACPICAACNSKSDPVCENALKSTCEELKCDLEQRLTRSRLKEVEKDQAKELNKETLFPFIHFGRFASGDMVMKSGEDRDHLTFSKDAIGFEMESAGVWDVFPCVIIKSVSDYADSHKNDNWQGYAAASAAGCTKAFLRYWYSARHESQSEIEEKTLMEQLIKSLYFPEINGRKNSLSPEALSTFEWVFDVGHRDNHRQSYESDHDGLEKSPSREGERILDEVEEKDSEEGSLAKLSDAQDGNSHRDFEQADNAAQSPRHSSFDSDDDDKFAGLSLSETKWDSFTDWLVSDTPIYWISGNPGSGKSTLMKYLLEHPRTSEYLAKWRIDTILLSHFFWKPGTQMQQSFKGLLCSLLYDLLSKDPEPFHKARDIYLKTRRLSTSDWSQNELRCIFLDYCQQSSKPICVFVDGLDEALPGKDVLDIVQFLKSLASSSANVKVCISSRPERLFRLHFESCPNLRMHELTKLDIAKYSECAMIESTLLGPQDQKISDLARQIAGLSDGIFLWAVLATQSLIRGINNGDSKEQTSRRLESMPQDLMDLYRDILSRSAADRPIYQKYVTLILNLVLVGSWEASQYYPMTSFVLTMAMKSDLLERYVVRGDAVQKSELESKVKGVKDTVEAAFVGLLEVKFNNENGLEEVVFPHRSVKDFLLDTIEGQNLWQPCNIPREELWARHFKSLLADGRLYSEDPDCDLTSGVVIRDLLSDVFRWEKQRSFPHEIIVSYLELARVSFLRGHLRHTPQGSPDLKPRCIEGEFLSHVVYGKNNQHVYYLLDKYGESTEESMYCLFFNICELPTFQARETEMRLIKYMLEKGYSPNWSTVNTPTTTGDRVVASPWFNFLIALLDRPKSFFPGTPKSDLGLLFSDVIHTFLKRGASLESRFPVVVQVQSFAHEAISIGLANQLTSSPTFFLPQYIVFEMNAKAAVDFIMEHYYDQEEKVSPAIQPSFLTARPYIKALAFTNRKDLRLFLVKKKGVSDQLVTILEGLSLPGTTDELLRHKRIMADYFQKWMNICCIFCPVAKDGLNWHGVRIRVSNS